MNGIMRQRPSLRWSRIVFGLCLVTVSGDVCSAQAIIGEILLVPYSFSPAGYAECNGQLLPISQNTALFSLLGTMYGGDGRTTFGLPDLRDRVPVGVGQGPGLSIYVQGQSGGEASHALTIAEMPPHTHTLFGDSVEATSAHPQALTFARNPERVPVYAGSPAATAAPNAIGTTGGGAAHNNLQPYLGLKYIIALQGVYPSRP
jgi:microcystin-dependent protein